MFSARLCFGGMCNKGMADQPIRTWPDSPFHGVASVLHQADRRDTVLCCTSQNASKHAGGRLHCHMIITSDVVHFNFASGASTDLHSCNVALLLVAVPSPPTSLKCGACCDSSCRRGPPTFGRWAPFLPSFQCSLCSLVHEQRPCASGLRPHALYDLLPLAAS